LANSGSNCAQAFKISLGIIYLHEDKAEIFDRVAFVNALECEDLMKTLQTPSSSASEILFPKVSVSRELVDISMMSALRWSLSLLAAVAIDFASAGPGYLEIATLTAFP
jgi:hypothetical protein